MRFEKPHWLAVSWMGDLAQDQEEAARRLIALVEYTKELNEVSRRDLEPRLALRGPADAAKAAGDDIGVMLHEGFLDKLKEAKRTVASRDPTTGKQLKAQRPVVAMMADEDDVPAAAEPSRHGWVSLHRPDHDDRSPAAQAACAAYASLFSSHQEALREGRGAQLTVGVGLVRWRVDASTVIDHPLVMMPAELQLDATGAYCVRMADASAPALWTFPGVRPRVARGAPVHSLRYLGAHALPV